MVWVIFRVTVWFGIGVSVKYKVWVQVNVGILVDFGITSRIFIQ